MSKNGPGTSDKGKGKAPRRPSRDEDETQEARERRLKPYVCPRCGNRYTSKGHMTRHAKISHGVDLSGRDAIEWDLLETLEFRAQQAAAQRRKRKKRSARKAMESVRTDLPGLHS